MNRKSIFILSFLFLVSLTLSSCFCQPPVLGIERSIVVKDVDLTFFEVETMESYGFGTQIFEPKAPHNMIIAIKAKTPYSNPQEVCNWSDKVKLEYTKDGKTEIKAWDICGSIVVQDKRSVRFFFDTYKDGVSDYQIVFPDGQKVPLFELIDIRTGEVLLIITK